METTQLPETPARFDRDLYLCDRGWLVLVRPHGEQDACWFELGAWTRVEGTADFEPGVFRNDGLKHARQLGDVMRLCSPEGVEIEAINTCAPAVRPIGASLQRFIASRDDLDDGDVLSLSSMQFITKGREPDDLYWIDMFDLYRKHACRRPIDREPAHA